MTDISTETPVEETPAAETATVEEAPEVDYRAEAEKWKALSRQNEAQAKANAEKAKQFDAIEEANKTELQKAQDALTAAQERAAAAELRALKADVSRTTGVPVELLYGTDEDSLNAAAQAALAFAQTQAPTAPAAPRVGGADINGGSARPTVYTRDQLRDPAFFQSHRDDILRAQREGRITP